MKNPKLNSTVIINELGSAMRETIDELLSHGQKKQKNLNKHIKKKKWWDDEMEILKKNVNKSDKAKLVENSTLKRIDALFHANRDSFWKEMRRRKKQNGNINVSINELKENFEKLFNERNLEIRKYEREINESLKTDLIKVERQTIRRILEELPNCKSVGFGDLYNELFKYGCLDELTEILAIVLETMINPDIEEG
ncbi:hypothetical protein BpHYR1_046227 [Brachionus plicatilis]|uniref:Uncharacterized protein n=1 Tax=Brachionus plicatilis TaxID=10195 RepID=A0A3M7T7J0_BRAPC|nr:hypothetical protein BpHYR1_046227 [Brachionus plicatilis]